MTKCNNTTHLNIPVTRKFKTRKLNYNTINVAIYNKTHYITTESLGNQIISTVLLGTDTLTVLLFLDKN